MVTSHQAPSPESTERGHEVSDVRIRGFVWFVVLFIAAAVVIHLTLWGLYGALLGHQPAGSESPVAVYNRPPPAPQLQGSQAHPPLDRQDMEHFRQREEALLNSYGWIDRNKGVAHIPIDRAMQLTLQRGLPVAAPNPQPTP